MNDGDSSRDRLYAALFKVAIGLGFEFLGALFFGSYMLWENFVSALYDLFFVGVNIFGVTQEIKGKVGRGWRIAFWSDAAFAAGFAVVGFLALAHLLNGYLSQPSGMGVLGITALATCINALAARDCKKGCENERSARLKLIIGTGVGLVTILDGVSTLLFRRHWIDTLLTTFTGFGVVLYIGFDLRQRVLERAEQRR